MENRTPASAAAPRPQRAWLWPALGVLALAAVGGWWMLTPDAAPASAPTPVVSTAPAAPRTGLPAPPMPSAARIVDAAPADATAMAIAPASMTPVAAGAGADPLAMLGDSGAAPAADPFAAVVADAAPAAKAQPVAIRRPARSRPASPAGDGQDLLSTLLHNIESSKQTAAADAATLDELVRQLREKEAPDTPYRSEQIQSNLRDCPPPNTSAGLQCRQEICAVYAGRDAACPALN